MAATTPGNNGHANGAGQENQRLTLKELIKYANDNFPDEFRKLFPAELLYFDIQTKSAHWVAHGEKLLVGKIYINDKWDFVWAYVGTSGTVTFHRDGAQNRLDRIEKSLIRFDEPFCYAENRDKTEGKLKNCAALILYYFIARKFVQYFVETPGIKKENLKMACTFAVKHMTPPEKENQVDIDTTSDEDDEEVSRKRKRPGEGRCVPPRPPVKDLNPLRKTQEEPDGKHGAVVKDTSTVAPDKDISTAAPKDTSTTVPTKDLKRLYDFLGGETDTEPSCQDLKTEYRKLGRRHADLRRTCENLIKRLWGIQR